MNRKDGVMRRVSAALAGAMLATALAMPGCAGPARGPDVAERPGDGDFGIPEGRCNRKAIGAVLGGAIGAILGSQIGEDRIALLVGAAAGTLIGSEIGRRMDEADLACIGEGLEKAGDNQTVQWPSADRTTTYRLVPRSTWRQNGQPCRAFELAASARDLAWNRDAQACRGEDGLWRVVR